MSRKIRVLLAKPGLDGHDRGAKKVARALRNSGMEVIYLQFASPERIVGTAIEEAVDIIGLSFLSGAHNTLLPKIIELLKVKNAQDIKVIAGGIIARRDVNFLEKKGVWKVFPQNVRMDALVEFVKNTV